MDHKIELEPEALRLKMALPELSELRKQLKELIDAGYIRALKAPFGAPVLFQNKHDASLRLCIDYRTHTPNQKRARATHHGLFDQLGAGRYFTKLDWRSGYYQVRIAEGDEGKTTCVTLEHSSL